jgi:hypothetical protein
VAVQAAEDAFYRKMKAAYDSAAAQVGLAKTAAEWDAAQATLRKAVLTGYSLVNDAQQSARLMSGEHWVPPATGTKQAY